MSAHCTQAFFLCPIYIPKVRTGVGLGVRIRRRIMDLIGYTFVFVFVFGFDFGESPPPKTGGPRKKNPKFFPPC